MTKKHMFVNSATPRRRLSQRHSFAMPRRTRGLSKPPSWPRRGVDMPRLGVDLRDCVGSLRRSIGPRNLLRFADFVHFSRNLTKNQNKTRIFSRKTYPKCVLTQPKPNIEIN